MESTTSMSSRLIAQTPTSAVYKASQKVSQKVPAKRVRRMSAGGRPYEGPKLRPNLKRGGTFYIYWTDQNTGRSRERSTGTQDREEAERYFANWRPMVERMFKTKKGVIGQIYFLRAPNAIKVGFAQNLAKRFADIQTANPDELILLGSVTGDYRVEKAILRELKRHHIRGEWLHAHPEVVEYVERLLTGSAALPRLDERQPPVKKWRKPTRAKSKDIAVFLFGNDRNGLKSAPYEPPAKP